MNQSVSAPNTEIDILNRSQEVFLNSGAILQSNLQRSAKAFEVGRRILAAIEENGGKMNEQLDGRCQAYLVNCAAAVREMDEARKPTTQIMDEIKKMFTGAENMLDPKKDGTPAFMIQKNRNDYAREVYEAEQRKREEAERKSKKSQEAIDLRTVCERSLQKHFSDYLALQKMNLQHEFNSITLEDIEDKRESFHTREFVYPYAHYTSFRPALVATYNSKEDLDLIITNVIADRFATYAEQFKGDMEYLREQLLPLFDSKKNELKEMANADAARREELQRQQAEREEAERHRLAEEQAKKEREAELEISMQHTTDTAMNLFEKEAEIAALPEKPEARQGYEITITHQVGYGLIFQLWFEQEGKSLSLDKLAKKSLGQMVTFCEKYAHANNVLIESPYIKYAPSFKAVNRKS